MKLTKRLSAKTGRRAQRGVMILEALIGVLIFSIGILGLVGMHSIAIRNVGDAKYRADASFLANKVISRMWIDNNASLAGDYATGGAKFKTWLDNDVRHATVGLPNGDATIVVGANNTVTVTVFWRAPTDPVDQRHSLVQVAQILK